MNLSSISRCHENGPFGYRAIPLVAGLLFALDRWMARRPDASPGAADDRLRTVEWFRALGDRGCLPVGCRAPSVDSMATNVSRDLFGMGAWPPGVLDACGPCLSQRATSS